MTGPTTSAALGIAIAFEVGDALQIGDTRLQLILFIVAVLFFIAGFALRDVFGKRAQRRPKPAKANARPERAR